MTMNRSQMSMYTMKNAKSYTERTSKLGGTSFATDIC